MVTLLNPGRRAIAKMRRQLSSLKLKDPGKRIFSTSASQIQIFFRERADTFEHERKQFGYILLSEGVLYLYAEALKYGTSTVFVLYNV